MEDSSEAGILETSVKILLGRCDAGWFLLVVPIFTTTFALLIMVLQQPFVFVVEPICQALPPNSDNYNYILEKYETKTINYVKCKRMITCGQARE